MIKVTMAYPYRIVICCPAGRAKYLSLLMPYVLREKAHIDEFHWWVNTDQQEDLNYMKSWVEKDPSFFKWIELTTQVQVDKSRVDVRRIDQFYTYCTDPKTLYIKVDDDIVWMQPQTFQRIINFRIKNPQFFLVYPNIINNVICSHLHQSFGALPYLWGSLMHDPFCELGWNSGTMAYKIHDHFLYELEQKELDRFCFPTWILADYVRTSINFIAWIGRDFLPFGGVIGYEDEQVLSSSLPKVLMRPCGIDGSTLVSHYAYRTQRAYLDESDLLERYRKLALSCQL